MKDKDKIFLSMMQTAKMLQKANAEMAQIIFTLEKIKRRRNGRKA